jgi:tripartite-type tricarboxylate transporter receptor subunit TctC
VIVENRLGASGTIAVGAMLAAPPDGHRNRLSNPAFSRNRRCDVHPQPIFWCQQQPAALSPA